MGNPLSPRLQKVTLGTYTILNVTGFTVPHESTPLDANTLGNAGWGGDIPGIKKIAGTISGWYDRADISGQKVLMEAWKNETKITNLRFYHDNTSYDTADLTNDSSAGAYIHAYRVTGDRGAIHSVEFSFSSYGQWTEV